MTLNKILREIESLKDEGKFSLKMEKILIFT